MTTRPTEGSNPGSVSQRTRPSIAAAMSPSRPQRERNAAMRWQRAAISPLLLVPAPLVDRHPVGQIERVQLGRSPARVSRVIFGSMAIGSARHDRGRRIATIHAALDVGMTSIDTAPMYDLGSCEEAVGGAIRGRRDKVQLLSKVGLRWDDPQGRILFTTRDDHGRQVAVRKNSRPESIRLEVERSLGRLGCDVIDIVHVHMRDPLTPIEDTMGALKDLLREGKLRAIGVSTNFGPREIAEAQRALGDVPLASLQLCYNLLERSCETELVPVAQDDSISILARSPLAMGLLTGKPGPWSTFDESDLRRNMPTFHRDNLRQISIAVQHGLAPIAAAHGMSVAAVALAWVLSRPGVSAVVVGASHPHQILANAEAVELELSGDEEKLIEAQFEALVLNPHAGLGFGRRSLLQGRWLASAIGRRLGR
jgi:aryl-alcohol dehydrogenase-like predicted oxidoreductase